MSDLIAIDYPLGTIKGIIKRERFSGYTQSTMVSDIIDEGCHNLLTGTGKVELKFTSSPESNNKIHKFQYSDNIHEGFQDLDKPGAANPLCFTYDNATRHDDDKEWSEFGIGLKSAAINCSGKWTIITYSQDKYIQVIFDWAKMIMKKTHLPECKKITKEDYRAVHPYETGTSFVFEQLRPELWKHSLETTIENLQKMMSIKYYKSLEKCHGHDDGIWIIKESAEGTVGAKTQIMPQIPPVLLDAYKHDIFSWSIELYECGECLMRNHKTNRYSTMTLDGKSKCSKDKRKELRENSKLIDTVVLKGTRVSGYKEYELPRGSIVMERSGRILSENILNGGRYLNFKSPPKNGEDNYHYLYLSCDDKDTGKNFGATYRKAIDCDFCSLEQTKLIRACKEIFKEIQLDIGGEGKFHTSWKTKYNTKWDKNLTYEENVENSKNPPPSPPADTTPSPVDAPPSPVDASSSNSSPSSPVASPSPPADATPSPVASPSSPVASPSPPADATPSPADATPSPADATPSPIASSNPLGNRGIILPTRVEVSAHSRTHYGNTKKTDLLEHVQTKLSSWKQFLDANPNEDEHNFQILFKVLDEIEDIHFTPSS